MEFATVALSSMVVVEVSVSSCTQGQTRCRANFLGIARPPEILSRCFMAFLVGDSTLRSSHQLDMPAILIESQLGVDIG